MSKEEDGFMKMFSVMIKDAVERMRNDIDVTNDDDWKKFVAKYIKGDTMHFILAAGDAADNVHFKMVAVSHFAGLKRSMLAINDHLLRQHFLDSVFDTMLEVASGYDSFVRVAEELTEGGEDND